MFSRLVLIALIGMPLAAREYTIEPRLHRAVYLNGVGVEKKELVRVLPSFRVRTPFRSAALKPFVSNVIREIRKFNAASRPAFTCDLDAILSGECQARELVIYQIVGGGKTADTIAGRSLAPLSQWDITKRYSLLPIRVGYTCSTASLRYDGNWRLAPPTVTCSEARADPWVIQTDVKPEAELLEEERDGLIERLAAAVENAIEANGDRHFVAQEKELARKISSTPIGAQISRSVSIHYVLELVVVD
jgi:hypothetical protein